MPLEDSEALDVRPITTLMVRAGLSAQFCRSRSRGFWQRLMGEAPSWAAQAREWEKQVTEIAELLAMVREQARRQGLGLVNDISQAAP